jgi:hypothetical protein
VAEHSDFASNTLIFYRQNTLPRRVAAKLTNEEGLALGVRAQSDEESWLWPLLLDARVLTKRHSNCALASRPMSVAERGLRGLLHGAGFYLEIADGGQLEETIASLNALVVLHDGSAAGTCGYAAPDTGGGSGDPPMQPQDGLSPATLRQAALPRRRARHEAG